jgi:hypothetical protein
MLFWLEEMPIKRPVITLAALFPHVPMEHEVPADPALQNPDALKLKPPRFKL